MGSLGLKMGVRRQTAWEAAGLGLPKACWEKGATPGCPPIQTCMDPTKGQATVSSRASKVCPGQGGARTAPEDPSGATPFPGRH